MSKILKEVEGGGFRFHCPGCGESHIVMVGPGPGPRWGYNGNPEKPTFTPSILIRSGHYLPEHPNKDVCWCTFNASRPDEEPVFTCFCCHSFVTDGKIQFLGDCTHALAGQTVPIPPFDGEPDAGE